MAALETVHQLRQEQRLATPEEQRVLNRWSGWGALPAVFDANAANYNRYESARLRLQELLSTEEIEGAARSTLNAHYTDPEYVAAIWEAVQDCGFDGGTVLEPGCGKGNFIGFAPEGASLIGIELESTTAHIAQALYPDADIRAESFADTKVQEGTVDLVVGNVPFGAMSLHDPRHNPAKHAIHNHFIIKSLHLLRPGGLMAVITSRYTMDAVNPSARREMGELAHLLGAVRLPSGAHGRTAGTDVVTDLLLFRRRAPNEQAQGASFELSKSLPGLNLKANQYFHEHPEHVLGELQLGQAEGGRPELKVVSPLPPTGGLRKALHTITQQAKQQGLAMTLRPAEAYVAQPVALVPDHNDLPSGYLLQDGERFLVVSATGPQPHSVPKSQAPELKALLALRNTVVALLEAEAASNDDTEHMDRLRRDLNRRYDRYVAEFGPINRFNLRRAGRPDPETGEPRYARVRPPQGQFRSDPFAPVTYALEQFDSTTQKATKTTIFRERVLTRRAPRLGADTPEDAITICLDTLGHLELNEVSRLLGLTQEEARRRLGTLAFDDPETKRLVPAAEYLSGNVRKKLRSAQSAASTDSKYAANVEALTAVIPRDLGPGEIQAQLGAPWISHRYVEKFLKELLDDQTVRVENSYGSLWAVKSARPTNVRATNVWGTPNCNALEIAQALLEQRAIRVYDTDADGNRTFNPTATDAATQKGRELAMRFSEWVWEAPRRTADLVRKYNDTFNAYVPRNYDSERPSLPGLALNFTPHPHQLAAVAQSLHEPTVGVFHEVGAGKTATMVMATMKKRQLGIVRKPAVVVPNHMLEQFTREWLELYPQAKVLAAAKEDLQRDNRRRFVARCATNDWDAVIMTRSAFERIPVSPDSQAHYLKHEITHLRQAYQTALESGRRLTLKRLERLCIRREEQLKTLLDSDKDPGLTFELMGIDYLVVDEFHAYKNLELASAIPGMAIAGSQRATDMHQKFWYLREIQGYKSIAMVATGTPIANALSEAYTMQRFLRPDLLEQTGLVNFDRWAATFGEVVTAFEVTPEGGGQRMHSRFAKFHNRPELRQMWSAFASIRTAADLQLPVPLLIKRPGDSVRTPEVVVVEPSDALLSYVQSLGHRADLVRKRMVSPDEDNMLSITNAGRTAALDLRLLNDPELDMSTTRPQKVDVAAAKIATIYRENHLNNYLDPEGNPHPTRGALQLVFSDLGTPKDDRWNVYDALREQLVALGIPRDQIRFIHEAQNDREKANLFAACRNGQVAVLMGSTERMGVGTNVQQRAVALHHLDCPWRPADITQREGRILRQGNQNAEVQILRYVTERSFDAYLWQTVARKGHFIGEFMSSSADRTMDIQQDDAALSYEEVKALSTGDMLLVDHAKCAMELSRLERLQRSHHHSRSYLQESIALADYQISELSRQLEHANNKLAQLSGHLHLTTAQRTYDLDNRQARPAANDVIKQSVTNYAERISRMAVQRVYGYAHEELATLNDVPLVARPGKLVSEIQVGLEGLPTTFITIDAANLQNQSPQFVQRLSKLIQELPGQTKTASLEVRRIQTERDRAAAELDRPFRQAGELAEVRALFLDLDQRIKDSATSSTEHKTPTGQTTAAPAPRTATKEPESFAQSTDATNLTGADAAKHYDELVAQAMAEIQRQATKIKTRLHRRERKLTLSCLEHNTDGKPRALPNQPLGPKNESRRRAKKALNRVQRHLHILEEFTQTPLTQAAEKATRLARQRVAKANPGLALAVSAETTPPTATPRRNHHNKTGATPSKPGYLQLKPKRKLRV